jgi:hypothetical protein
MVYTSKSLQRLSYHGTKHSTASFTMEYSRDECVTAFREFYHLLAKMYMDESYIKEPPPGGWPNITPEALRPLNKTEEAVSLLKYLPYIDDSEQPFNPQCLPFTPFADWTSYADGLLAGQEAWGTLVCTEGCREGFGRDEWEHGTGTNTPSRFIGLTSGEREDIDVIILDAQYGRIYWLNCAGHIQGLEPLPSELDILDAEALVVEDTTIDDQPEYRNISEKNDSSSVESETPPTSEDGEGEFSGDDNHDNENDDNENDDIENDDIENDDIENDDNGNDGNEDHSDAHSESDSEGFLSCYPSWPVVEFFEMLKSHYRQLNFVPENKRVVAEGWNTDVEGEMPLIRSIFRKHGWPDLAVYRKEACLAEVKRTTREKWPDEYSDSDSDSE